MLGLAGAPPPVPGLFFPELPLDPGYVVRRMEEFGAGQRSDIVGFAGLRMSWPGVRDDFRTWFVKSLRYGHSERNAFHASVRAARRAGTRAADTATTVTTVSTPARIAGCQGVTP
jgi:hypothetical protein